MTVELHITDEILRSLRSDRSIALIVNYNISEKALDNTYG